MKIDPKRLRLYAVTDRAWTHDAEGLLLSLIHISEPTRPY